MAVDTKQVIKNEVIKVLNVVEQNFGISYTQTDVSNVRDFFHDLSLDGFKFISLLNSFFNSGQTDLSLLKIENKPLSEDQSPLKEMSLLERIDEEWCKNPVVKYNLFDNETIKEIAYA